MNSLPDSQTVSWVGYLTETGEKGRLVWILAEVSLWLNFKLPSANV